MNLVHLISTTKISDISFSLGPILNSASRLGYSNLPFNLLIEKIEKKLATIINHNQNEHITSPRQEQLLIKVNKTILPIIKHQETNIEIIAHHTKEAINHFDHLLGKTNVDDILDDVFSNFCVGK